MAAKRTSPWLWYFFFPLAAAGLAAAIGILLLGNALSSALNDPKLGEALVDGLTKLGDPLARYSSVTTSLHDGRWAEALRVAEQQPRADNDFVRGLGEQAFVFSHVAWPLATSAPAWLAQTDAAQRARWLGDTVEPPAAEPPRHIEWGRLLDGIACEVNDPFDPLAVARASLLAAHLAPRLPDDVQSLHDDQAIADDALARLLRIRLLPPEQRADAFAAYAQRLPLEASEHWLAQLVADHLRGRTGDGTHAAEMAWLSGAGELAVLLDAFLQVAPLPGGSTWRTPNAPDLARLRKRVAGGDRRDAPAGVLMLALLDALGGVPQDFAPLRELPQHLCAPAQAWFTAAAAADPVHAAALGRIGEALGAEAARVR